MSTNLNYKQVTNVERRTWDKEAYEKKAKARLESAAASPPDGHSKGRQSTKEQLDDSVAFPSRAENEKEEFAPAERGAAGPEGSERAYLKARHSKVDLESKVGTSEIIAAEAAATTRLYGSKEGALGQSGIEGGVVKTGVGWHCRVCDCFLKDSHTYLDHINGRKHQRKLGYSMRVERSSKEQLLSKLSDISKKKEQEEEDSRRNEGSDPTGLLDYHELVKSKDDEARRRKEERQRRRLERKKKEVESQEERATEPQDDANEDKGGAQVEADDEEEAQVDPALAAMMGFTGFGGGTKTR